MTVVIGYLDNDGVAHIASDGMGSNGFTNVRNSFQKVNITKDENLILGYAGRFDLWELMYYSYLPESEYKSNDDGTYNKELAVVNDEYFFTQLRYNIRKKMIKIRFQDNINSEINSKDDLSNISLLIAHEGLLYEMQGDYELLPINKGCWVSIGSGQFHTESAMNIMSDERFDDMTVKEKFILAIKSATDSVVSVGNGMYYANTQDYKVERIE